MILCVVVSLWHFFFGHKDTKTQRFTKVFCVMLLCASGLLESCSSDETKNDHVGEKKDLPSQESWNTTVILSDSGLTKAVAHVHYARSFESRQETFIDSGVAVDFFSRVSGERSSLLTSDRARIDDATQNMEAHGHVVVKNDSGTVVETEDLYWDAHTRKLHSDTFVRITSPTEHIEGYGFESDDALSNYVIYRVSGQTTQPK